MVRFIGISEVEARERLAPIGTELVVDDGTVVERVLADGERQVRAEVDVEPPSESFAGMGAWHVNGRTEAHGVLSGRGIVQFWTEQGPVTAVLEAGDAMVVRGGEHRYLPLTSQRWVLRHSGDESASLDAVETGRAAEPWPDVD